MKKSTRVNHPPPVELAADNHPVVPPIYQSVKFEFDSLEETERYLRGERPGFFYTRASNPTTRQLELLLAEMQGREECLVTASGVGAVAQALLALTKQGDHILCFVETYNPTRYLIRRLLGRFGVTHTMLSIEDVAGIERALAAHPTRLVWFESPTNPMTKVADIPAITRLAKKAGALVVMDNTFAGLHQHGEYDIDVFAHSLTKYASGAGDVLGGAVIGRGELIRSLRMDFGALGGTLDPHAAFHSPPLRRRARGRGCVDGPRRVTLGPCISTPPVIRSTPAPSRWDSSSATTPSSTSAPRSSISASGASSPWAVTSRDPG